MITINFFLFLFREMLLIFFSFLVFSRRLGAALAEHPSSSTSKYVYHLLFGMILCPVRVVLYTITRSLPFGYPAFHVRCLCYFYFKKKEITHSRHLKP